MGISRMMAPPSEESVNIGRGQKVDTPMGVSLVIAPSVDEGTANDDVQQAAEDTNCKVDPSKKKENIEQNGDKKNDDGDKIQENAEKDNESKKGEEKMKDKSEEDESKQHLEANINSRRACETSQKSE